MAMLSFGGIDVSKDRLDVMILPEERCSSVPNDAAGWADLVERLSGSSIAVGRVKAVAARSAGARSASLDATKSISDLPATR
jgi:hypothetical protein